MSDAGREELGCAAMILAVGLAIASIVVAVGWKERQAPPDAPVSK